MECHRTREEVTAPFSQDHQYLLDQNSGPSCRVNVSQNAEWQLISLWDVCLASDANRILSCSPVSIPQALWPSVCPSVSSHLGWSFHTVCVSLDP